MEKALEINNDALAKELLEALLKEKLTVAFAESCTGGMCQARMTALPGSSAAVEGGVVSYSNNVKERVLGVRAETLSSFGAVSVETAREMAEGVGRITGADISVSVTGIAGPGGGSEDKPVGTVCFGVSLEDFAFAERVQFESTLTRAEIRALASDHALSLALKASKREVTNA